MKDWVWCFVHWTRLLMGLNGHLRWHNTIELSRRHWTRSEVGTKSALIRELFSSAAPNSLNLHFLNPVFCVNEGLCGVYSRWCHRYTPLSYKLPAHHNVLLSMTMASLPLRTGNRIGSERRPSLVILRTAVHADRRSVSGHGHHSGSGS